MDLLESKTEIISSTGYKNAFKEMYPFIFMFKKDNDRNLHLQPRNGRRSIEYE